MIIFNYIITSAKQNNSIFFMLYFEKIKVMIRKKVKINLEIKPYDPLDFCSYQYGFSNLYHLDNLSANRASKSIHQSNVTI